LACNLDCRHDARSANHRRAASSHICGRLGIPQESSSQAAGIIDYKSNRFAKRGDPFWKAIQHLPHETHRALSPDGPLNPGVMHTVATGSGGHLGLYRLETQVTSGSGTLKTSGLGSNSAAKEAIKVGFDYFKANANRVSASIKAGDHDYHLHVVELHNTGPTTAMTLAAFVALCARHPAHRPWHHGSCRRSNDAWADVRQ
jgi:predicted ATP-dependent Lon-type protease